MSRIVRKQKVIVGQIGYYEVLIVAVTESTVNEENGGVAAFVNGLVG